jgi:hypothetical protein
MNTKNLPVVVCYPPGAGGSMLGSVLNTVFNNCNFNISNNGNCHQNNVVKIPHYVPTGDLQGFKNELCAIESGQYQNSLVIAGHVRNLVAMQSIDYNFWFIKIVFDHNNNNEVEFLHRMLTAKVDLQERLKNCYSQVRFDNWPDTLAEFLTLHNSEELFRQQNYYTLTYWFWVESPTTQARTIELSIQDIFLKIPGEKLSCWYNKTIIDKLFVLVQQYQTVNRKLYPDTFKLLQN